MDRRTIIVLVLIPVIFATMIQVQSQGQGFSEKYKNSFNDTFQCRLGQAVNNCPCNNESLIIGWEISDYGNLKNEKFATYKSNVQVGNCETHLSNGYENITYKNTENPHKKIESEMISRLKAAFEENRSIRTPAKNPGKGTIRKG